MQREFTSGSPLWPTRLCAAHHSQLKWAAPQRAQQRSATIHKSLEYKPAGIHGRSCQAISKHQSKKVMTQGSSDICQDVWSACWDTQQNVILPLEAPTTLHAASVHASDSVCCYSRFRAVRALLVAKIPYDPAPCSPKLNGCSKPYSETGYVVEPRTAFSSYCSSLPGIFISRLGQKVFRVCLCYI